MGKERCANTGRHARPPHSTTLSGNKAASGSISYSVGYGRISFHGLF
jgi:hypothetical protein